MGLIYYNVNCLNNTDIYDTIENEGIDDDFSIAIFDDNMLLNGKIVGFVYFGRDTCQYCRLFNKYLSVISQKDTTLMINKYDTDYWRDTKFFDEILSKYSVNDVPVLVNVKMDGSYTTFGLSDADNIDDIYDALIEFIYE